jgi:hypothetical protein
MISTPIADLNPPIALTLMSALLELTIVLQIRLVLTLRDRLPATVLPVSSVSEISASTLMNALSVQLAVPQ